MKIVFADCFSGVSGDMLLGALIGIGADKEFLYSELSSMQLDPFSLEVKGIKKGAMQCTQCRVITQSLQNSTRGINDIQKIIEKSPLKQAIKDRALKIFQDLAYVEAKIHDIPVSKIHFHEIGATDSLVDVLGVLIACDYLGIEAIYSSPLCLGRGIINTLHGPIPAPAPATLAILENVPVIHTGIEAELVTPTGAALIKHLSKRFGLPPQMTIRKIGYGAGQRDLPDRPNCLRLILGESDETFNEEIIQTIECDIDDMNPESYPYIMESLFEAGALDVSLSQIIMKKGRPGIRICVLSKIDSVKRLADVMLTETTTIGVRINQVRRYKASREVKTIRTQYGPVRFKYAWAGDKPVNLAPEYEDYSKIARKYNRPLKCIYQDIMDEVSKKIGNGNIVDKQKM
ncbi:nickel pincer cofactor biosynthesis protein LarC [bacterium]|nr:nickel pincer cofactor biosynthesis protein LarC [bacterium]